MITRLCLCLAAAALALPLGCGRDEPAPAPATAPAPPPRPSLDTLRAATVLIEVEHGEQQGSGSGFLVHRGDGRGLVVTNQHVVDSQRRRSPAIRVVFRSGQVNAQSLAATVVASDAESDLAVLAVEWDGLPEPLDVAPATGLEETLPVRMLGYPFGEALSLAAGKPAITIGTGTVSSFRRDELGEVAAIQIDGDINPGNSGGPVVTEDGRLVGVAVATVLGTQISFVIPAERVVRALAGALILDDFKKTGRHDREIEVRASRIDPHARIAAASALIAPKRGETPRRRGARWPHIGADAREFPLKLRSDSARAVIAPPDLGPDETAYWLQFQWTTSDDERRLSRPYEFRASLGDRLAIVTPAELEERRQRGSGRARSGRPGAPRDTSTRAPAMIDLMLVASGGARLVLGLRTLGIGVYEVDAGEIARFIELPGQFMVAAGGDVLLVYDLDSHTFQTWSLTTGKMELEAPCAIDEAVTHIVMGRDNGRVALVRFGSMKTRRQSDRWGRWRTSTEFASSYAVLDLESMSFRAEQGRELRFEGKPRDADEAVDLTTDPWMILAAEWSPGRPGLEVYSLATGSHHTAEVRAQRALIGDDLRFYTDAGTIWDPEQMTLSTARSGTKLYPAVSGGLALAVTSAGDLYVYGSDPVTSLVGLGKLPAKPDWLRGRGDIAEERALLFNPYAGHVIWRTRDTIYKRNFDLQAALKTSDREYLVVLSPRLVAARWGEVWEHQVVALSNARPLRYRVQMAPQGVAIDDDGWLTWKVPSSAADIETVIVGISDDAGRQLQHRIRVLVL